MDTRKILLERDRLKKRIDSMERTLEKRKKEFDELETAIKILGKYCDLSVEEFPDGPEDKTIMDMILEILSDHDGLPSQQILQIIHEKYKRELERTSMSPQLSRLKRQSKIDYTDGKWFLFKQTNEEDFKE